MKTRITLMVMITMLLALGLVSACSGNSAAIQPEPSGISWQVHRYKAFDKVWASLTSTDVSAVTRVFEPWKTLVMGGYVAVDKSGQAELRQGTCYVYFFKGQFGVGETSYCEKGSGNCIATYQNCREKVYTASTANLNFTNTLVTIIELIEPETLVIITHEGEVEVTYTDNSTNPGLVLNVPEGNVHYVTTWDGQVWARETFGFEPEESVPIDNPGFINGLEQLELDLQLKRLNLLLGDKGFPRIPIELNPYLNAVFANDEFFDSRIIEAVQSGAQWNEVVIDALGANVSPWLYAENRAFDLRDRTYFPQQAVQLMNETGFSDSNPLTIRIWYDVNQEEVLAVAFALADQLNEIGFMAEVLAFNDGSVAAENLSQGNYEDGVIDLVLRLE
jgi:hypothetical protein